MEGPDGTFMVDRMFCRSLRRMACRGVVVPAAGGWDAVVVGVWEGKAAAVTGLWEVSDVPPLPLVPGDDCTLIGGSDAVDWALLGLPPIRADRPPPGPPIPIPPISCINCC